MAKAKAATKKEDVVQKRYQVRAGFVFVLQGEQGDKVYRPGEEVSIDQEIGDAAHQLQPLDVEEGGGEE